jgi:hypothetical protein
MSIFPELNTARDRAMPPQDNLVRGVKSLHMSPDTARTTPTSERLTLCAVLTDGLQASPVAQHASIRLVQRGGVSSLLLATTEQARCLAHLEERVGEGPSVSALRGKCGTALLRSADERPHPWARLAEELPGSGLASVLASRLVWDGRPVGVLTLSFEEATGPSDRQIDMARGVAVHIGATIAMAQKVAQLETAMVTRQEIGQAIGILMERYQMTPDAAFAYLRRLSQDGNIKLHDVAEVLRVAGRLPGECEGRREQPAGADQPETKAPGGN